MQMLTPEHVEAIMPGIPLEHLPHQLVDEMFHPRPIEGQFAGKDVVSITQFDKDDIERVLEVAAHEKESAAEGLIDGDLKGKTITEFFYEDSTRTVISFENAALWAGAYNSKTQGVQFSSVSKGESFPDTMRTIEALGAKAIVLRHPRMGAAAVAGAFCEVPVINGGDGPGEHPTQALLDLFTIREELGRLDDLTVTMVGDLRYGRTVHSLSQLLAHYNVKLNYVSPQKLRMPKDIRLGLHAAGVEQQESRDLGDFIDETDVLYVTRVQKERFQGEKGRKLYEAIKDDYIITPETMERAREHMAVMHPLPRVNEIDIRVDFDPHRRAAYFRQVSNGVPTRKALLKLALGAA